jgi:hypothetical protein
MTKARIRKITTVAFTVFLAVVTAIGTIGCATSRGSLGGTVETPEQIDPGMTRTMTIEGKTELDIGESVSLSIVADFTYDSSEVTWTSSNPGVATVDKGMATAVASGLATITAEIAEPAVSASIEVSVVDPEEQARQAAAEAEERERRAADEAAERERQTALDVAVTPSHSFSVTLTDSNGYKIKADIRMGDWIKGSEANMLQRAWEKVSGSGGIPITSGSEFKEGEYGGMHALNDSNYAVYVFGTIAFSNLTTDYPAKNFGGGFVYFPLRINNAPRLSMFSAVQYGSSTKTNWSPAYGSRGVDFIADMQSNNWGPVPFVIVFENVFTPEYPNGNPALDGIHFDMCMTSYKIEGDTKLVVGKTW